MPRGSSKSRASPYPKTRPNDSVAKAKGSPAHQSVEVDDVIEKAKGGLASVAKQLGQMSGLIQPGDNGTMKVTNNQEDKWELAAKIESEVMERDLELRCSDGAVVADQSVLAAVSNFLKEIFNCESVVLSGGGRWPENATGPAKIGMIKDRRKADLVSLLVPDIDCHTMYSILACFYWGFIPLTSSTNTEITEKVQKIKAAWNLLQIDVVISRLEPVDNKLEIPEKKETRLVKTPRYVTANVKIKKEFVEDRPRRQSTVNTSYAELNEDDPDDPAELPDIDGTNSTTELDENMKVKMENNYTYSMMEIHQCIRCKGRTSEGKPDKEATSLSFKDKNSLRKLREHYCKCFYAAGKIFGHVDPEDDNRDASGNVIDEFGNKYKYQCKVKGCWKQKKECGYKELAMHNAIEHGVLEEILALETDQRYVNLLGQIRAAERRELSQTKPLKCRVKGCPDSELLFENIQDYAKLQTHYAVQHYRAWFVNRDDGGKARNQKVLEPGRGTICRNCRERVYGNEELMMGHYASKHKRLADAVMEGVSGISEEDDRNILVDLYPDRVAEFDRARE